MPTKLDNLTNFIMGMTWLNKQDGLRSIFSDRLISSGHYDISQFKHFYKPYHLLSPKSHQRINDWAGGPIFLYNPSQYALDFYLDRLHSRATKSALTVWLNTELNTSVLDDKIQILNKPLSNSQ